MQAKNKNGYQELRVNFGEEPRAYKKPWFMNSEISQ